MSSDDAFVRALVAMDGRTLAWSPGDEPPLIVVDLETYEAAHEASRVQDEPAPRVLRRDTA